MWAVVVVVGLQAAAFPDPAGLDGVLAAAVQGDRVDYDAVERERPALRAFLDAVATTKDLGSASDDERLAFIVNAYNATVLHEVLVHGLARRAGAKVVDVKGFFDARRHPIAGLSLTLNELEAQARKLDARVHFVVNCASIDCPPLRVRAYRAATLDADLETQTRQFLSRPEQLRVDVKAGVVVTSQLLEWYAADFGDVRAFLARYAPVADLKITFRPYDWRLNAAPTKTKATTTTTTTTTTPSAP